MGNKVVMAWPDLSVYGSALRIVHTPQGRRAIVVCASGDEVAWRASLDARLTPPAWVYVPRISAYMAMGTVRVRDLRQWFPEMGVTRAPSEISFIPVGPPTDAVRSVLRRDEIPRGYRFQRGIEVVSAGQQDGAYHWVVYHRGSGVVFTDRVDAKARDQALAWAEDVCLRAAGRDAARVRQARDRIDSALRKFVRGHLLEDTTRSGALDLMRVICAEGVVLREVGGFTDEAIHQITKGIWSPSAVGRAYVMTPADRMAVERMGGVEDPGMGRYIFPAHQRAAVEEMFRDKAVSIDFDSRVWYPSSDLCASVEGRWAPLVAGKHEAFLTGQVDPIWWQDILGRFVRDLARSAGLPDAASRYLAAGLARHQDVPLDYTVRAPLLVLMQRTNAVATRLEAVAVDLGMKVDACEQAQEIDVRPYWSGDHLLERQLDHGLRRLVESYPSPAKLMDELAKPSGAMAEGLALQAIWTHLMGGKVASETPAIVQLGRAIDAVREETHSLHDAVVALRESVDAVKAKCRRMATLASIRSVDEVDLDDVRSVVWRNAWQPVKFNHGLAFGDGYIFDLTGERPHEAVHVKEDVVHNAPLAQRALNATDGPCGVGVPVGVWRDRSGTEMVGLAVRWTTMETSGREVECNAVVSVRADHVRYFRSRHPDQDVIFRVPTPVHGANGVLVLAGGKRVGLMSAMPEAPFDASSLDDLISERESLRKELFGVGGQECALKGAVEVAHC